MSKRGIVRPAMAVLIILSMLLAACTSNTETSNAPDSPEKVGTDSNEEVVTLRLLIIETGSKWNTYPDSAIAEEIAKKVGVKIEYVEADDSKFNVLLAGGDLPDIVRTEPAKYGKQLIDGNLIIPMDDMLKEHGKDITANIPTVVEYSKENWSEGKNQLFFLPPQVQSEPSPIYPPLTIGPTIRWDYYKEIGAPAFNTPDELLDVLEQIVQKHPQTEDGKKIYGVSMWQDWGLWPYIVPFAWYTMQTTNNSDIMARKLDETQYRNILMEEDSTFWVAVDFYNKANRRGLLDPDALTMKNNDYSAKATAGQIVIGPATWAMGDFNSKYAKDGKGYVVLPTGKRAWSGGVNPLGWTGKSYAISKSSKHPEKAMQFLNYLYSYEGVRTLYSGVEGVHWEMIDGKPQIKDETFELRNAGGTAWENTGIALDTNLMGIGGAVLDPVTNSPLDLFQTQEALAQGITELEKDFSDHYGAMHPGEVLGKLIAEGKLQDANTISKDLTTEQRIKEGKVGLPAIPEDMLKIEAQVKELAARYAAKLILAKTDDEFNRIKEEALKAFKDAGVDKFTEFYTKDITDRREAVGALPAKLNN
ncbi:extracellular solute-binding protein [Paenibacillus lautus]|uniref:extracellular solute-binding protein n=1 Tax=Paenibacillus lautus TaxID=1401 RepID=UPI001C7D5A0C|nr:extracellular solute-binding protein [Paenibacillus lautus]MBX4150578.1 extracellular solute-binding protein [Paenibacillus lautus]